MKPPARLARLILCSVWAAASVFLAQSVAAQDQPLVLLVQPTRDTQALRRDFHGLVEYLERATDRQFTVRTTPNFLAHWGTVRRDAGYDLVLDEAHFTDYRVQKLGFLVLAKVPGATSYSLATATASPLRSPLDLAGQKVASFGPPSLGAMRLYSMFPNPARRPVVIEVSDAERGLALLRAGTVAAAMLPSAALATLADRNQLTIISTAEPTPSLALSISPRVSPALRETIQEALLRLGDTEDGRERLRQAGIGRLDSAVAGDYDGQARILRDFWGY